MKRRQENLPVFSLNILHYAGLLGIVKAPLDPAHSKLAPQSKQLENTVETEHEDEELQIQEVPVW